MQAFRKRKDRVGHKDLAAFSVLRRAGCQPDYVLSKGDLVDLHVQQFRDSPAVGASAFDDGPKPKLGLVRHDLTVSTSQ